MLRSRPHLSRVFTQITAPEGTFARQSIEVVSQGSWTRRSPASRKKVLLVVFGSLAAISAVAQQAPIPPEDPTLPLRRFPFSIEVKRPGSGDDDISILHVAALHPKDDVLVKVDPEASTDYTFVTAYASAGQKIKVQSWNLWDKEWTNKKIDVGVMPNSDVIPLFFLVLNKKHEKNVSDAVKQGLETASQNIISACATFETTYQQQNRLLNFMTAYAALGPKQVLDPHNLQERIDAINADLGINYAPQGPATQPADLQTGLDAGVGLLNAIRASPDNPAPLAQMTQSALPALVSDWIGLVADLVHIFVRPPKEVKLLFIPASVSRTDDMQGDQTADSMELLTQRAAESTDGALPTLVYRPTFERTIIVKNVPCGFEKHDVLASDSDIEIPLASESRDLFLHPWAWDWQMSTDNKTYSKVPNPKLIPGTGLVIPISTVWWGTATEKTIYIKARVGFKNTDPIAVHVAREFPQKWAPQDPKGPPLTAGEATEVELVRTGTAQSFYRFASVTLIDSAKKIFSAEDVSYNGVLRARFSLAGAEPGYAQVVVRQEGATNADPSIPVFIAPKHPEVAIYCGLGDPVLRIAGADAGWVKAVNIPDLKVLSVDDAQPNNRLWTLSGPVPKTPTIDVTFHEPTKNLEWTRPMPLIVGLARPHIAPVLFGTLPDPLMVGAGKDPTWAEATLPAGWFNTKEPVRVQLKAVAPFAWTHNIELELGLGPAGDVQKVATLPEGSSFALDEKQQTAMITMTMDAGLPADAKRNTGLVWIKLTRDDLISPWTIATLEDGSALRAVKVPIVQSVDTNATRTRITLSNVDQVLGVRFTGQKDWASPQLAESAPPNLMATIDGPVGATEFDLEMRDASEGVIHIKIVRQPMAAPVTVPKKDPKGDGNEPTP
ncbi:MAG TPA: hypothetical protein VGL56_20680 [Fimbriimonadaceae bacterium]|jgi:hypothetical protein